MAKYDLQTLMEIMAKLRSQNGCPWDKEQTHYSLISYLIEETYEVIDAINQEDPKAVADELGDLLLQIVFHAQIGRENKEFTMEDVLTAICEKMIRRHPHVFADTKVGSVKEVLTNWEAIKKQERKHKHEEAKSLLDGIPSRLPALIRAEKVQSKAAKVGFQWQQVEGAVAKLTEELGEFKQSLANEKQADIEAEFGDLLFSLVNIARYFKISPESALNSTTSKFINRFKYMEKQACIQNRDLESMSLAEMDELWEKAKKTPQL